jgi:hypothetical protein
MTRSTAHIPRPLRPTIFKPGRIHGYDYADRVESMLGRMTGDLTRSKRAQSHFEIERWTGKEWVRV